MRRTSLLICAFLIGVASCDDPESTHEIDCSLCSDEEVCWYTTDFDGKTSGSGCVELPQECAEEATCDCINSAPTSTCAELEMEQNFNACSVEEGVPLLFCVSTLG